MKYLPEIVYLSMGEANRAVYHNHQRRINSLKVNYLHVLAERADLRHQLATTPEPFYNREKWERFVDASDYHIENCNEILANIKAQLKEARKLYRDHNARMIDQWEQDR